MSGDLSRLVCATVLTAAASIGMGLCRAAETQAGKAGAVAPRDVSALGERDYALSAGYLKKNGRPPIDYVVEKFKDHDLVILGEMHEIKEYCAFVSGLVEPLYRKAGVRVIAMESLNSKNNDALNRLASAGEYDRKLVVSLFRDFGDGIWGFKEYMDIPMAVWQLNRALPADAEKMRLIGLNSEWTTQSIDDAAKLTAVEEHMVDQAAAEILENGKKGLVQIGYNHSFVKYRQLMLTKGGAREFFPRFAYLLYQRYGDRVFQVCLHEPHFKAGAEALKQQTLRDPLGGLVEKAYVLAGGKPLGFDVDGSPFANLRDREDYFFDGQDNVVFSDLAEGYVILKPFADLDKKMTWVGGFISDGNFARARAFALARGWVKADQCKTSAQLDARLKRIFEEN